MLTEETPLSHYSEDVCRAEAKSANLRYVRDDMPGIRRRKAGRGFAYYAPDGSLIRDEKQLRRIRSLAIPPAYRDVWICPCANGHLQATGRDAKGRKQYRYHPEWRSLRDGSKFSRVLQFGRALPHIRQQVEQDLQAKELTRERVLAALVRLMEESHIRIGNAAYAEAHGTYGLTTLRKRHLTLEGDKIYLSFKGKNRTPWRIRLKDRHLARVLKRCVEIPGYELFKYLDETGERRVLQSQDLNAYLQSITGAPFTAKDFRTYAACREAFLLLRQEPPPESSAAAKRRLNEVCAQVAELLGHTPAICRKSYIHAAIFDHWQDGRLADLPAPKGRIPKLYEGREEEYDFLRWWEACHLT